MKLTSLRLSDLRMLVFGTALAVVAVSCAAQYWSLSRLTGVATTIHHGDAALALLSEDMLDDTLQLRRFEKDILINVGSADVVQSYRSKWDDAFVHLRHDLTRARWAAPTGDDPRLQAVVDSMAAYQSAFLRTYAEIRNGTLTSTQQASAQAESFKEPARTAERMLAEIGGAARIHAPNLNAALGAQRSVLIVSLLLLLLLAALLISGTPRDLAVGYSQTA